MRANSLEGKLASLLGLTLAAGTVSAALLSYWLQAPVLAAAATLAPSLALTLWLARRSVEPIRRLLRALEGAVASYRDGDFSLSLAADRRDELGTLIAAHNELGQALRRQRADLQQRELLLDTVVQNTPVALVLVDGHRRVVFSNLAARHLLDDGRSLQGQAFGELLQRCPAELAQAVSLQEDCLVPIELDGAEETFHLSQRDFNLQGRAHRLYLFRRLTRELSRQEVGTWKKLIRVVSHELNNSLAPISSLAHSGAELIKRGAIERLPDVFATIGERARHLQGFIEGYASLARLPAPRFEAVEWSSFLNGLALQGQFRHVGSLPEEPGVFDRSQIEQVLINLLKNARESGSPADAVELEVVRRGRDLQIEVRDRGEGMSEAVLGSALLPFYSTKRSGTGLGLALAREIVEAHDGRITLSNRDGGGLRVTLLLPQRSAQSGRGPR
ncbi:MAG: HAMP domain-containing protein [Gammaproteobacteria bacterium]|nr:HAMP domain-containing protein [Gammaproteobacteria bacterium]